MKKMKKITSIILVVATSLTFTLPVNSITPQQQAHEYKLTDVLTILKYLANMIELTPTMRGLYSITSPPDSDKVSLTDVIEILKHLAWMDSKLGKPSGTPPHNIQTESVLKFSNAERAKEGLPPLTANNAELNAAAQKRAEEIVVRWAHDRPDGRSWGTVLAEYNVEFRKGGENLAQGQRSAQDAVTAWMNSTTGHRENILNSEYTQMGVGYVVDKNGRMYWVQLFILPK